MMSDINPWASNTEPPPEWALSNTGETRKNTATEDVDNWQTILSEVATELYAPTNYGLSKRQLAAKVAQHLIEKIGEWS